MSDDEVTVDTIARFVYASELLAPGADMDSAPVYDKLPATEKRRLREIAAREIARGAARWLEGDWRSDWRGYRARRGRSGAPEMSEALRAGIAAVLAFYRAALGLPQRTDKVDRDGE